MSLSDLHIGPMLPDEAKTIVEMIRKTYDKNTAGYSTDEGNAIFYDYLDVNKFIERNQSNHFTLVAKSGKDLIGMIEIRDFKHISLFFVHDDIRGNGIGKRLFDEALKKMVTNGTTKITVHSSPNAVPVYERLGFIKISEEKVYNGLHYTPMYKLL